MRAAESSTA